MESIGQQVLLAVSENINNLNTLQVYHQLHDNETLLQNRDQTLLTEQWSNIETLSDLFGDIKFDDPCMTFTTALPHIPSNVLDAVWDLLQSLYKLSSLLHQSLKGSGKSTVRPPRSGRGSPRVRSRTHSRAASRRGSVALVMSRVNSSRGGVLSVGPLTPKRATAYDLSGLSGPMCSFAEKLATAKLDWHVLDRNKPVLTYALAAVDAPGLCKVAGQTARVPAVLRLKLDNNPDVLESLMELHHNGRTVLKLPIDCMSDARCRGENSLRVLYTPRKQEDNMMSETQQDEQQQQQQQPHPQQPVRFELKFSSRQGLDEAMAVIRQVYTSALSMFSGEDPMLCVHQGWARELRYYRRQDGSMFIQAVLRFLRLFQHRLVVYASDEEGETPQTVVPLSMLAVGTQPRVIKVRHEGWDHVTRVVQEDLEGGGEKTTLFAFDAGSEDAQQQWARAFRLSKQYPVKPGSTKKGSHERSKSKSSSSEGGKHRRMRSPARRKSATLHIPNGALGMMQQQQQTQRKRSSQPPSPQRQQHSGDDEDEQDNEQRPLTPQPQTDWVQVVADQQQFFQWVVHQCVDTTLIGGESSVPTLGQWLKRTPHKGSAQPRSRLMKAVDLAVSEYHTVVDKIDDIVRHCRVAFRETGTAGSATSQLGFAYPGFDSQVFDVGSLAVVSPWLFFEAAGLLAFTSDDWEGALQSSSAAKELMQSSPDVTALYEDNRVDEAKEVMLEAQRTVLQNIMIASYLKTSRPMPGNLVTWKTMCPPAEEFGAKNRQHLARWENCSYLFNSDLETASILLQSDWKDVYLLCEPGNFLILLRTLLRARKAQMNELTNALRALKKGTRGGDGNGAGVGYKDAANELVTDLQGDAEELDVFLAGLPADDVSF